MNSFKRIFTVGLVIVSAAAGGIRAQEPKSELSAKDQELMERLSVAYGTRLARDLRKDKIHLNMDAFAKAFIAISEGKDPLMDEDGITKAFDELQAYMVSNFTKEQAAFQKEYGKREGVTTTSSGLQWEVLTPGTGAKPKVTDKVTVHYVGTLITGEQFDSSIDRGQPATFGLDQVIAGWTEGVQLMPIGAKYRFIIPADLAYGAKGSDPQIPGGATLIFEVELLKINGQ
ncbi:MAG: FKBP-type peptidyl-prolyl cis-trans isomerase [Verrucomicrobiales bacterium]|jgi:FKBP-type peptidyl-prolyl cis-trans isomerase